MPLSIRDIQYCLAVARCGQLSSAAMELGVTQPALTKAVMRVEEEFGLQLFERTARGMTLTSAGMRVNDQLAVLQNEYADTMHLADEMRASHAGLLRLGVTDMTASSRMASALGPLLAQRPGLRVRLKIDRSDSLDAQISDGSLDLALIPAYEGQPLVSTKAKIAEDPMLPLVRKKHPLAPRSSVSLGDVAEFGWVMGPTHSAAYRTLASMYARARLRAPQVVVEVPFASELNLAILGDTDLVTLVPQSFMPRVPADRFAVLPVSALRIPRSVVLLSRAGATWSPLMKMVRERLVCSQARP